MSGTIYKNTTTAPYVQHGIGLFPVRPSQPENPAAASMLSLALSGRPWFRFLSVRPWLPYSMRLRRSLPIFIGVLLVAAAVAAAVFLRKHAPPEPARLLPGADGFIYLNLQWMRRANLLGHLNDVPHD